MLSGSVAANENHVRSLPASQEGRCEVETVDEPEATSDTLQPNPESDGPIALLRGANASGNVLITGGLQRFEPRRRVRDVCLGQRQPR